MSLVELNGKVGVVVNPFSYFPDSNLITSNTLNAVGESIGFIGRVYLTSGPGTSKTVSSAGGKVWWVTSASITWASAGTTLRVGIQDVNSANGLEDGVYDVFDDLVQGVDPLIANSIKESLMSSGSKTITHGDVVAVVIEMTVRNGTDAVNVSRPNATTNFPYMTSDLGTLAKSSSGMPWCAIQFDDGTIGHFGNYTLPLVELNSLISASTIPDEHALVFQLPFKCTINGLFLRLGDLDIADDGDINLIRDPFGTITNLATVVMSGGTINAVSGTTPGSTIVDIPETEILANTEYAISHRATTTGTRMVKIWNLPNSDFRQALPILCSGASRSDAGAFANSLTAIPDFGFRINKIDAGGGGATSVAYIG